MERRLNSWCILVVVVLFGSGAMAQQCLSTGNGNWNNASSWSCDGVNRLPTCGDTVRVESGDVISVTNQNDYIACGQLMILDVSGDLAFTNGNKIDLPCNSVLSIQSGGEVYKSGPGGGSSTLISICGTNVWRAGDGPLSGPVSFGGEVLPIELISFRVLNKPLGIELEWITATETNNDYFTLYNSANGMQWQEVGQLKGAGNSNEPLTYKAFFNENELQGSYFKLEQTDINGESEVVGYAMTNEIEARAKTIIWPNPSTGSLNIDVSNFDSDVAITLYTIDGMRVYSYMANPQQVTKSIDLSALEIEEGVFLLVLEDQYRKEILKFSYIR